MIELVDETTARQRVSHQDAFGAVHAALAAMASGTARNFPVVREPLPRQAALFGVKSGHDDANNLLGLKAGGYWSENAAAGQDNHQSSILLFHPATGQLKAVVSGNYLTSVRTAAAAAVSIASLARPDAQTLTIIGAGRQAEYQVRAALHHRDFRRVRIANRTKERAMALAGRLADTGLDIAVTDHETAVRAADVLITIVSAHTPQVERGWIAAGTHIAAMGTDTRGKQELDTVLVAAATCFTDEVAQSVAIGECQHAIAAGLLTESAVHPIGEVLNGARTGRRHADEITLFDGTGVALQDLAVAALALAR